MNTQKIQSSFENVFNNTRIDLYTNILLIILLVTIILYIFETLAVIRLVRRNGFRFRYLAWIPAFNIYFVCKLAFNGVVGLIAFVASILTSTFSITISGKLYTTEGLLPQNIVSIIQLILSIILIVSVIRIYKIYSNKWLILTILTILSLGLLSPIFLFAIRNNQRPQMDVDNFNTNASVYLNNLNKGKDFSQYKVEEEGSYSKKNLDEAHVENEYDISDAWNGPK